MNMPIAITAMQRVIVLTDINVKKRKGGVVIYQSQPDELLNSLAFSPRLSDVFHVTL